MVSVCNVYSGSFHAKDQSWTIYDNLLSSDLSSHYVPWISTTHWRRLWDTNERLEKLVLSIFVKLIPKVKTEHLNYQGVLLSDRKYKASTFSSACNGFVDEVSEVEQQMLLEAPCMVPLSLFLLQTVCNFIETSVLLWPLTDDKECGETLKMRSIAAVSLLFRLRSSDSSHLKTSYRLLQTELVGVFIANVAY